MLAGNVAYAACQWLMLIILAKTLTPAAVGEFALALAVTTPIVLLTSLKLRSIVVTDVHNEHDLSDYLGIRTVMSWVSLAAIVVCAATAASSMTGALVIVVVGMAKLCDSTSEIYLALLQRSERLDLAAVSLVVNGVVSMLLLATAAIITRSIAWAVIGSLGGSVLALAFSIWATYRVGATVSANGPLGGSSALSLHTLVRARYELPRLRRLVWLGAPLGAGLMLASLNTSLPRYFLEATHGKEDLGIFSALAYVTTAGGFVMSAMGTAVTPRLARAYSQGNLQYFRKLLSWLLAFGVAVGAAGLGVALVVGESLLSLIYRPEYARHTDVFMLLMLVAALFYTYTFLGTALTAMRRFHVQLPISISALAVQAGASALLVGRHGMMGAAEALLAATSAEALLYGVLVVRHIRRP